MNQWEWATYAATEAVLKPFGVLSQLRLTIILLFTSLGPVEFEFCVAPSLHSHSPVCPSRSQSIKERQKGQKKTKENNGETSKERTKGAALDFTGQGQHVI